MAEKFNQRFNIEVALDEAKRRFTNRANNFISEIITLIEDEDDEGSAAERFVCTKLGERWKGYGCLTNIIGDSFDEHLRALEALYEYELTRTMAEVRIKKALSEAEIDLGIRWSKDGFLPSGSALLDEKLVNDVLGSKAQAGVMVPFRKGLDHFLHSNRKPVLLSDVVTDMYEALEAQAKIIADNDKDLSANAELFISRLSLSNEYKPILKAYISYANEFRHAAEKGQKKDPPSKKETESFIYMTGLFLRLMNT
jgi:hypothetical protein